ncbi:hypothetical protein WD019_03060 [Fictibacillus sp. Mic-4]|uniref:hypothetical protein n=1 Tax=Fictibacillus sp. Mic-4 TaxID=3132826 RepID=UPI003CF8B9BB
MNTGRFEPKCEVSGGENMLRKIRRIVKEFITFKYESEAEMLEHGGSMCARGYGVYEVKNGYIVTYEKNI